MFSIITVSFCRLITLCLCFAVTIIEAWTSSNTDCMSLSQCSFVRSIPTSSQNNTFNFQVADEVFVLCKLNECQTKTASYSYVVRGLDVTQIPKGHAGINVVDTSVGWTVLTISSTYIDEFDALTLYLKKQRLQPTKTHFNTNTLSSFNSSISTKVGISKASVVAALSKVSLLGVRFSIFGV